MTSTQIPTAHAWLLTWILSAAARSGSGGVMASDCTVIARKELGATDLRLPSFCVPYLFLAPLEGLPPFARIALTRKGTSSVPTRRA